MTALAIEAPVALRGFVPKLQRTLQHLPERRSGIVVIGSTTISRNGLIPQGTSFHPDLVDIPPVDRRYLSVEAFRNTRERLEHAGMQLRSSTYGHAAEVGLRLHTLLHDNPLQEGMTPVTVITFADVENKKRLRVEFFPPVEGLNYTIFEAKNSMPQTLAYAVKTESGIKRVIYSTTPDLHLTKAAENFDITNDRLPEHVIIGSLPEQQSRAFLRRLVDKLVATDTPYTYIPGMIRKPDDAQAVEAISKAIKNAASLVVTEDELSALIADKGKKPADTYKLLMLQGLSALQPKSLFVTLNRGGALGVTRSEFEVAQVAATHPVEHTSIDDYRDAFAVGTLGEISLIQRLQRGSISASFLPQMNGNQAHHPSEFDMFATGKPEVYIL